MITDHPYQGAADGKYCDYDPWEEIDDPVDFCNLPRSAHADEGAQ